MADGRLAIFAINRNFHLPKIPRTYKFDLIVVLGEYMFRTIILGSLCLALTACGTARTVIEQPATEHARAHAIQIMPGAHTVFVPARDQGRFSEALSRELYNEIGFSYGPGITARYRFVSYSNGNRFARLMLGGVGNTGEASIVIETEFLDERGSTIGKIETEGRIDSGMMGGRSNSAVYRAAEDIADYAREHFYSRYE